MKMQYDWASMEIWQMLAALIPFKSKRYVKKWLGIRKDWIKTACVEVMDSIRFNVVWQNDVAVDVPNSRRVCSGFSMRDMWDNALEMIARIENMRNADELKIWLDMRA